MRYLEHDDLSIGARGQAATRKGSSVPEAVPLLPLKRDINLREVVLEHVRTAIVTGELQEGSLVSAPTLGQALGVSATPVREAMMDLAREGLVETVKNKGFRVTQMSDKELNDLSAIRMLLEPPAMQHVVGRVPESGFEELTRLADECLAAAEAQDLTSYLRNDREFHRLLLSFTDNSQLVELASSLRLRTRMYGLTVLAREGVLPNSAREHHRLIDCIRAEDGAGAEQLLREHIGHARKLWATGRE